MKTQTANFNKLSESIANNTKSPTGSTIIVVKKKFKSNKTKAYNSVKKK
jgi:hypothetical protein